MLAQLGVPSLISCIGNISALINTQDWQYFKHLVLIVRRWAWSLFCVNVWRNHAEKPSAESRQIQTNLYVAMLQRWQSEEPVYCLNISDISDLNAVYVKLIFPSVLLCRVGNDGMGEMLEKRGAADEQQQNTVANVKMLWHWGQLARHENIWALHKIYWWFSSCWMLTSLPY